MEETTTGMETAEQTSDAFLEGLDDVPDTSSAADQPETKENREEPEQTDAADGQSAESEEKPGEGEPPAKIKEQQKDPQGPGKASSPEPENEAHPKTWDLRHLDEIKTVNEQGMISLAQKGLDYDRIREKYDESKPVMELFGQFAKQAGMDIPAYVAYIRTQAKKAGGMSDDEAKRAVELEDREAAVAAKENQQKDAEAHQQTENQAKSDAAEKRKADIEQFRKEFPDAAKEPDKIPKEVWDDVRKGMSLSIAYAKYAIRQEQAARKEAEHKAASSEQNQKNASRSAGSMQSAGNKHNSRDPFLEGWDS